MKITTAMVATASADDGRTVAAWWDGGPEVRLHVVDAGGAAHVSTWRVWNEEWDCPLVEPTFEAFTRFVALRLGEPGTLDELLAPEA
jgi:hypothetical protein